MEPLRKRTTYGGGGVDTNKHTGPTKACSVSISLVDWYRSLLDKLGQDRLLYNKSGLITSRLPHYFGFLCGRGGLKPSGGGDPPKRVLLSPKKGGFITSKRGGKTTQGGFKVVLSPICGWCYCHDQMASRTRKSQIN